MAIGDTFWAFGNEAVGYGTRAATLTRAYENKEDSAADRNIQYRSRGMRRARVGIPADRSVVKPRGGSIPLTIDALNKSMGLFLAAFGSGNATVTTPDGATTARLITVTPTTAGPTRSGTLHAGRADINGTLKHFDYLGCIGTQLDFTQNTTQPLELKGTFDYKEVDPDAASVSEAYAVGAINFLDQHLNTTIDGDAVCLKSFTSSIPTGVKTDRDRICPSGRARPILAGVVTPTGQMAFDYDSTDTNYAATLDGTIKPLVYEWDTGVEIEDGFTFLLRLSYPAAQFTGSPPKDALDAEPEQSIAFDALDDATDGTWKIEAVTTDTAL